MTPTISSRTPRWLGDDDLAPALLIIALAAFALVTPAQNDTWWHLRSGRQMWESGWFLTREPFSHTSFGMVLRNDWWLTQLVFYGVFSVGGPVLLSAFAGAWAFCAVLLAWRLVRGPLELRVAMLAFLLIATAPEWAVRPQVISLALLVITAHLVSRDKTIWIPAVCVVWANAHPMVIFGLVMAGACVLEAAIWSRRYFARDMAILAASAVAPMISPEGWHYWSETLATVSTSRELRLQEYLPAFTTGSLPFWLAAVALGALTFHRRRELAAHPRSDRILLIAAGVLALAAVSATRNIAFFAVIAAPAASRVWGLPRPQKRRLPLKAGGYVLLAAALIGAGVYVVAGWRDGTVRSSWTPMSSGVIDAVRTCPGPLFNRFEDGGYLMWALPERKVFVDSRINAYTPELLRRSRTADLFGDYRQLFHDYRIGCAVVATGSPMYERLLRDSAMTRTYLDSSRAVFAAPQHARD